MTQPVTDGHEIDARLQKMDGRAVPQAVRVKPLSFETGTCGAGAIAVLAEEIPYAESSQRCASVIDEEWLCRRRLIQKGFNEEAARVAEHRDQQEDPKPH